MINSESVKEYGLGAGASIVGIAASKDFNLAPNGFTPSDNLEGCLSVIVLGIAHPQEALKNAIEYTATRNAIYNKITDMAKKVERLIKANGHKAKAISASGGKTIDGNLYGHLSLKHAAELAGLGIIGRNYLLTNTEYGNLLWFSAVLTDADLTPDRKTQDKICDSCNRCVKICPMGALDDANLFGKKECSKNFKIASKKLEIQYFLCRTVCPYRFGKNA